MGISVGVSTTVGVVRNTTWLVVGVGVSVAPNVELPYAEAAQIQRRSAAMSVPHPRPILVFRERVLNQCLKPDGGFGG